MKNTITTADKFFNGNFNDKIFIKCSRNKVIGFIRIGTRHLFISNNDTYIEDDVNCLMDFYVHHRLQRQGHGKKIFDKMLRFLNIQSYKIAYDNPSPKLLNFLYKNYSLKNYIKQNNNFIVFNEFFTGRNNSINNLNNNLNSPNSKNVDYNYFLRHDPREFKNELNKSANLRSLGKHLVSNGNGNSAYLK